MVLIRIDGLNSKYSISYMTQHCHTISVYRLYGNIIFWPANWRSPGVNCHLACKSTRSADSACIKDGLSKRCLQLLVFFFKFIRLLCFSISCKLCLINKCILSGPPRKQMFTSMGSKGHISGLGLVDFDPLYCLFQGFLNHLIMIDVSEKCNCYFS